jgi:hypothetical protein
MVQQSILRRPNVDEIILLHRHYDEKVTVNRLVNGKPDTVEGTLVLATEAFIKIRPDEEQPNSYIQTPFRPPEYYATSEKAGILYIKCDNRVLYDGSTEIANRS